MLSDLPVAAVRYAALVNMAMKANMPDGVPADRRMIDWDHTDVGVYEQYGFDYLPWLIEAPHYQAIHAIGDIDERLAELARQGYRSDWGAADDISQVLARYPDIVNSPTPYLLTYMTHTKENSPDWRWHKQGEYLGVHEPQFEHLGDEPDIDQVITWKLWQVLPEPTDLAEHFRDDLATWLVTRMGGQYAPIPHFD